MFSTHSIAWIMAYYRVCSKSCESHLCGLVRQNLTDIKTDKAVGYKFKQVSAIICKSGML